MTRPLLTAIAVENGGYETPELNDKLYLHFRGFRRVQNLEPYTALKSIWLSSNGLEAISGLDTCVELRCIFMDNNLVSVIEGLSALTNLVTLNLSGNRIGTLSGLSGLLRLSTLNVSKNALRTADDVRHLTDVPSLTNVDVSDNHLEDATVVADVFKCLPSLTALYLKGNPLVRSMPHYRKTVITELARLRFLDDRPVFHLERCATEAWKAGGPDAERKVREEFIAAEREQMSAHSARHREWMEEVRARRAEELEALRAQARAAGEDESSVTLPRKQWVSYARVSPEEAADMDLRRRAVALAEAEAQRDAIDGLSVRIPNVGDVEGARSGDGGGDADALFDSGDAPAGRVPEPSAVAPPVPPTAVAPVSPVTVALPPSGPEPPPLPTVTVGGQAEREPVAAGVPLSTSPVPGAITWTPSMDSALSVSARRAQYEFGRCAAALRSAVSRGQVEVDVGRVCGDAHSAAIAALASSITADACRLRFSELMRAIADTHRSKKAKQGKRGQAVAVSGAAASLPASVAGPERAPEGAPAPAPVAESVVETGVAPVATVTAAEPVSVERLLQGDFDQELPFRDIRPSVSLPSMGDDDHLEGGHVVRGGGDGGGGAVDVDDDDDDDGPVRPLTREEIIASLRMVT